jgi:polysaccharide chain length determinant protein (PEP-CTERM system associated)
MIRKEMGIQDYWGILLRRKWFLIAPFLTVTLTVAGIAYILPDIYLSTTLILVEPQKVPENYVRPTVTARVEDRLKTITQQIMSRTRLERIIEEYNLYKGTGQKPILQSIHDKVPIWSSYWGLQALTLDAAVERMRKDITVTVKGDNAFTISYQGRDPEVTMQVTGKLASLFIEENLKVREQQAEGTSEFLENELNNSRQQLERHERQIREFKQKYMGELPQQLEANLRALDRFQTDLKTTNEALAAALERKESTENLLAKSDLLNQDLENLGTENLGADVADSTLLFRVEQLKAQLSRLQLEYKEDYPDIVLIRKQIKELEATLTNNAKSTDNNAKSTGNKKKKETGVPLRDSFTQNLTIQLDQVNLEIAGLKNRRANLTRQTELYEKRVENTPLREQQLLTIMRDYENIQRNYQSLLEKRLQAKIFENLEKRQQGEIFRILDPANYPTGPHKPDRWKIVLLGIIITLGSGVGLILFMEQMDQSIRTEDQLWEALGIPVLASIPRRHVLKRARSVKSKTSASVYKSSTKIV